MDIPVDYQYSADYKIKDFIFGGVITIPQPLHMKLSANEIDTDVLIPIFDIEDEMVWEGAADGIMTVKKAYEHYRENGVAAKWVKQL